jgi:hypothetical protein
MCQDFGDFELTDDRSLTARYLSYNLSKAACHDLFHVFNPIFRLD